MIVVLGVGYFANGIRALRGEGRSWMDADDHLRDRYTLGSIEGMLYVIRGILLLSFFRGESSRFGCEISASKTPPIGFENTRFFYKRFVGL